MCEREGGSLALSFLLLVEQVPKNKRQQNKMVGIFSVFFSNVSLLCMFCECNQQVATSVCTVLTIVVNIQVIMLISIYTTGGWWHLY